MLFSMEGSFRLFLTLSTAVGFYAGHPTLPGRRGPHTALPLRVWSRQGTVDPVSRPFRVLPRGESCGGPTRRRLPSLQDHRGALGCSPSRTPYKITHDASPPSPGTTHLLLSLKICLFWTSLINGQVKCVLLCLLLSLTIVCSRSIHDVACVRTSLLFMVTHTPLCAWTTCC